MYVQIEIVLLSDIYGLGVHGTAGGPMIHHHRCMPNYFTDFFEID